MERRYSTARYVMAILSVLLVLVNCGKTSSCCVCSIVSAIVIVKVQHICAIIRTIHRNSFKVFETLNVRLNVNLESFIIEVKNKESVYL